MSTEQMKALKLESELQLELCNKIIQAAEIVYDIYGELLMTSVVEEVLETEHGRYSAEEIQGYLFKMVSLDIIDVAS